MDRKERVERASQRFLETGPIYEHMVGLKSPNGSEILISRKDYKDEVSQDWYRKITKTQTMSRREFCLFYFRLISTMLTESLTENEIRVAAEFAILVEGEDFTYERFGTNSRITVRERFENQNWKLSEEGLNNYINSLRKKGVLYMDEDRITRMRKGIEYGLLGDKMMINFIFNIEE